MKARQWTLLAALGLTLAATWWAARIEDAAVGEVAGVVAPAPRADTPAAAPRVRPRAAAPAAAASNTLAIVREPWPAAAADLLQPSRAARVQLQTAPTVAAPSAPPLPFTFIGSIERGGRRTVMLMEGDELHLVGVRERIGDRYRVERVTPTQIEFTYLPLQLRQVLETGQD